MLYCFLVQHGSIRCRTSSLRQMSGKTLLIQGDHLTIGENSARDRSAIQHQVNGSTATAAWPRTLLCGRRTSEKIATRISSTSTDQVTRPIARHTFYYGRRGLDVRFVIRFAHNNLLSGLACFCMRKSKNMAPSFETSLKYTQVHFFNHFVIPFQSGRRGLELLRYRLFLENSFIFWYRVTIPPIYIFKCIF